MVVIVLQRQVAQYADRVWKPSKAEAPSEPETRGVSAHPVADRSGRSQNGFLHLTIPPSDRGLVLREWVGEPPQLLERLPLNYDDMTLKTIEQIDVLWLRGRSIARAFEVEQRQCASKTISWASRIYATAKNTRE